MFYQQEEPSNSNAINKFDFSEDDFKLVYDNETPFELRLQNAEEQSKEAGNLESIREGNQQPLSIKIELTSEADLFFNYLTIIDQESYPQLKQAQKLHTDFNGYLSTLIKMFNNCLKEQHKYFAIFLLQTNGLAKLDFIQNLEFKFIELFHLEFQAAGEEIIRQNITYRYNILKAKLLIMENRLKDINQLIKVKNPSLLIQLAKNQFSNKSMQSSKQNSLIYK